MATRDLLALSLGELEGWCAQHDVPRYRAAQIASWVYQRGAWDFAAMTNVPRELRARLVEEFQVGSLTVALVSASRDGTRKLLFRLADGAVIESVLIPDGARLTLCVSTQVGCGMGCDFCATATLGFRRHLTRGEIVEQLLRARDVARTGDPDARVTNL